MKAEALSGRSCGRQNAFLEALRVVKTTSREAFAGKRASFSRLRRAGPPAVPKAELRAGSAGRSAASRRQRTAHCPTPRRNVTQSARRCPDAGPQAPDEAAPDTEFPDAATRHEPPDAPRSGKKLSRVHPARDALTLAAPRLSPPRRRSTPDAVSLRVSGPVTPHGLAVQRCPWVPAETTLRVSEPNLFCAARKTSSCADQGNSLTSCRGVPTGRRGKKSAGILSASLRERPKPVDNTRAPPFAPKLRSVGASAVPRAHLPSDLARKTHGASAESSTSSSASPSRGSRPHGSAAPSRRADTGAQRLPLRASSKNIPAFKLENPSAAEAGDGNESTKEIPYLPSFLRRVRTVSDSSAPLPTQACSFSLSMLRVPGLVLGL